MKKISIILLAVLLNGMVLSCSRSKDTIGPEICPSSSFQVTQSLSFRDKNDPAGTNSANLDLSASYGNVSITFSEAIDYKVTISAESGAKYEKSGNGASINLNWYGNSTNGMQFKQGDVLTCKVTNLCYSEPLGSFSGTVISTIIGYNSGFGLKITNFEDGNAYNSYGAMTVTVFSSSTPGYVASPQGGKYMEVAATSATPVWYFGGVGYTGVPLPSTSLGTDPSKVYLNFYARGQANSQAQMIFKETVYGSALTRKYLANVTSDWKLYSVKLSDIGIINPSQITNLDLNLGAAQSQDLSAKVDIDLILFTFDSSL